MPSFQAQGTLQQQQTTANKIYIAPGILKRIGAQTDDGECGWLDQRRTVARLQIVKLLSQRDGAMLRDIEYFSKSHKNTRSFEMTLSSLEKCVTPY